MLRVNVQDAKTNLSKYLVHVQAGQKVVLCRRNIPIAEIVRVLRPGRQRRVFGVHRSTVTVEPGAFEG